jgi:hypothetical protein
LRSLKQRIDGIWKEYYGSAKIKLARAGNKNTEYYKCLKKSAKKYENAGNDTKADQDRPWAEIFSKTIIKGWKVKDPKDDKKWVDGIHLPNDTGEVEVVPFNHENVVKVLLLLPDFFEIIRKDADDIKTFQKEKEEKEIKN